MAPGYGTARILDPAGSDQGRTSAPSCDFKPAVKAAGSLATTRRPSIWRTFLPYLWPKFREDSLTLCRGERSGIAENMSSTLTQSVNRGGAYFREMHVPAPKTSRELFRLFLLYDKETGVPGLAKRINFTDVKSAQMYFSILQRLPESRNLVRWDDGGYDPSQHFCEMLWSDEFQSRVIRLLLSSFPEKRRLIHIHIPKSAGSHFFAKMAPVYPCINQIIQIPGWTSKQELMEILAGFASIVEFYDFLMVLGHFSLNYVVQEIGVRFGDEIFSVVRHPVTSAISMANYVASRLIADPSGRYPDTREWLDQLGMETFPEGCSSNYVKAVALAALHDDRIAHVNPICHYLGDGTSESAINNIVINNVEITDTCRYDRWLERRWGISTGSRINQSLPILNHDDVIPRLSERLSYLCSEDMKVFEAVKSLLDARDAPSIKGHDLA
jgi:hypothetical protein